jgi:hypothetical protein
MLHKAIRKGSLKVTLGGEPFASFGGMNVRWLPLLKGRNVVKMDADATTFYVPGEQPDFLKATGSKVEARQE